MSHSRPLPRTPWPPYSGLVLLLIMMLAVAGCDDPPANLVAMDVEAGHATVLCQDANMVVHVIDDIVNDEITIEINDEPVTLASSAVSHLEVDLCGQSNWFDYRLAGGSTTLSLPHRFTLTGHDGFDYVSFYLLPAGQRPW